MVLLIIFFTFNASVHSFFVKYRYSDLQPKPLVKEFFFNYKIISKNIALP